MIDGTRRPRRTAVSATRRSSSAAVRRSQHASSRLEPRHGSVDNWKKRKTGTLFLGMRASGMNICFAAVLGCAALLAIAALAWGTASPAGHAFETGSDAAPEQFGDKGADGTTGPAGVQDDVGPDLDNGDPGADSDRGWATQPVSPVAGRAGGATRVHPAPWTTASMPVAAGGSRVSAADRSWSLGMCGIAGAFAIDGRPGPPLDQSVLERMTETIRHRGPDDDGFAQAAGDVPRRPPSQHHRHRGRSPAAEQRERARSGPPRTVRSTTTRSFATSCGRTATRSAHVATRRCFPICTSATGAALCERLHGKFAVAVWDSRKRRGILARDRLGVKPLYYAASTTSWSSARS